MAGLFDSIIDSVESLDDYDSTSSSSDSIWNWGSSDSSDPTDSSSSTGGLGSGSAIGGSSSTNGLGALLKGASSSLTKGGSLSALDNTAKEYDTLTRASNQSKIAVDDPKNPHKQVAWGAGNYAVDPETVQSYWYSILNRFASLPSTQVRRTQNDG